MHADVTGISNARFLRGITLYLILSIFYNNIYFRIERIYHHHFNLVRISYIIMYVYVYCLLCKLYSFPASASLMYFSK